MEKKSYSSFDEWKQDFPNGCINEYYSFTKNKETIIPSIDNLEVRAKEYFYIGPMTKLFIVCIVVIAIFKYEYISEKISQARTFISEKTNMEDPDGFNQTSFDNREAELAYIREYANYKISDILRRNLLKSYLKTNPNPSEKDMKIFEASANLNVIIGGSTLVEQFMTGVIRSDATIQKAKDAMLIFENDIPNR